MMEERLAPIRATDPKKFALFTGRDQMQALTGLFAKQFGTPNYAAHGGFCSVNMAAGMIYTIGGSFWEFGGPDLERSKLFVMIGTAEDHHSNPMKIELSKFKRNGGKFISINPVRTGYSAIADEWIPIKPGTDGALLLALTNEIIKQGLYDREFLVQYSNSAQLGEHGRKQHRIRHVRALRSTAGRRLLRSAEQTVVGSRTESSDFHAHRRRRSVPARRIPPRRRHTGQTGLPDCWSIASRTTPRNGRPRSPAYRSRPSSASLTRWASSRVIRKSNCRFPGPTPGARNTSRLPATRYPSTPCAGWRRIRMASIPSARCRY